MKARRWIAISLVLVMLCSSLAFAMDRAGLPEVVARMSAVTHRKFNVNVVENGEYNAWTDPQGNVAITSAFLAELTPDQAAFVFGHEFTHVVEKHAGKQLVATLLGALGVAAAAYFAGLRGKDLGTAAQIGGSLNGAHQSRKDEYQSDTEGLTYSVHAGYRAEAGPEAMRILEQRYGRGDAGIPIVGSFASHPDTLNRVINLEKVAAKLEAEQPVIKPEVAVVTKPADPGQELTNAMAGQPVSSQTPVLAQPATAPAPEAPVAAAPVAVDVPAPVVTEKPSTTVPAPTATTAPTLMKVGLPGQKFGFGTSSFTLKGVQVLHVQGIPEGTARVAYRVIGPDGTFVLGTDVEQDGRLPLYDEQLRSHGQLFKLEITALGADGLKLDLATITIVVG